MKDAEDLSRASRVIGGDLTGMELLRDANTDQIMETAGSGSLTISVDELHPSGLEGKADIWEVASQLEMSEADVARIFPRVVTHRLRVRDGPQDEILGSAVFGAVHDPLEDENSQIRRERSTIKDILVRILSDV